MGSHRIRHMSISYHCGYDSCVPYSPSSPISSGQLRRGVAADDKKTLLIAELRHRYAHEAALAAGLAGARSGLRIRVGQVTYTPPMLADGLLA